MVNDAIYDRKLHLKAYWPTWCRDITAFYKKNVRRLWPEVLSGLLHDVYTMRSSRRSVATAAAAVMRQRYRTVSHELNMIGFVRLSMQLSHRLYKLKPIRSISEMTWHLECGRDFEVVKIVKQLPCSLANGPQRTRKERTPGCLTLLCISCTSVAQCEQTAV